MPFLLRPYRRFPTQCSVTYNAGPFQGQGTVWNLSCTAWCLSGDLPMRPGKTISMTITLPHETMTVKDFLTEPAELKIQELEQKRILPRKK